MGGFAPRPARYNMFPYFPFRELFLQPGKPEGGNCCSVSPYRLREKRYSLKIRQGNTNLKLVFFVCTPASFSHSF